jgi:salicylate hydroxylase
VLRKAHENRRHAFSPALAGQEAVGVAVAREWQQERVRERLDWLYHYDATAIAV